MHMISLKEAALHMQVPTGWAQGMVDKGQLDAVMTDQGLHVDADAIAAKGWDTALCDLVPSYAHLAGMLRQAGIAQAAA